jgi:hypothetical protein
MVDALAREITLAESDPQFIAQLKKLASTQVRSLGKTLPR